MAGTVLQKGSASKLAFALIIFVAGVTSCFLLGMISPYLRRENWSSDYRKALCQDSSENTADWVTTNTCRGYNESTRSMGFWGEVNRFPWRNATGLIYSFRFDSLSKWQQNCDIRTTAFYSEQLFNQSSTYNFEYKLGYLSSPLVPPSKDSDWQLLGKKEVTKELDCKITFYSYGPGLRNRCEPFHIFRLPTPFYESYLLNMKISTTDQSQTLEMLKSLGLTLTCQIPEFSRFWWSLKTFFSVILLCTMTVYCKQIRKMASFGLVEKSLLALGCFVMLYNLPLEWFTLGFNWSWIPMIEEICKTFVYISFLSFWVIFTGENFPPLRQESTICKYWKSLSLIFVGCLVAFIPDLVESFYQTLNPFFTLWSTKMAINLELVYMIIISIFAIIYCLVLTYRIRKVMKFRMEFKQNDDKISAVPEIREENSTYLCCSMLNGLIEISFDTSQNGVQVPTIFNRYKALMVMTFFGVWLTAAEFIVRTWTRDIWKWSEDSGNKKLGEFYTGVYGFWNLFVIVLMYLHSVEKEKGNLDSELSSYRDGHCADNDEEKLYQDESRIA